MVPSHTLLALGLLALSACAGETVTGYGGTGSWTLSEINGTPFQSQFTMVLDQGTVHGQAPCNSFQAEQTLPYPWFGLSEIAATRMACADLDQESRAFAALRDMTTAETSDTELLLSNPDTGAQMVFTRAPADQ